MVLGILISSRIAHLGSISQARVYLTIGARLVLAPKQSKITLEDVPELQSR